MVMEYIEKNVENGAESEPEDGKKPDEKEADKSDASNDSDFEPVRAACVRRASFFSVDSR